MRELKRILAKVRSGERGVVIIYTAFFLLLMLGFVALGIDVAKLMATRTQLQNAADAAALAGASAISPATGAIVQDTAITRAQLTASQNKAFVNEPLPVQLLAADVSFPAFNQVKVTVRRQGAQSVVTHIAQVLGIHQLQMTATATAEADTTSAPCEGLVPMAPVQAPEGFETDCAKEYNLKMGAGDALQGNYELLDYPPCGEGLCQDVGGGGAEIRCYAHSGYGCCLEIGDQYTLSQPGNKVGPFRQGMQTRFDADTDQRENICYSEYRGNGNRVVRVPIIKSFDVPGKKYVQISGFAAFFVKVRPPGSGTLTGQFIFDIAPGEPGGSEGTLFSIRLIK